MKIFQALLVLTVVCITLSSQYPQGTKQVAKPKVTGGKPTNAAKPNAGRATAGKPNAGKPNAGKPNAGKPVAGKPNAGKPVAGKPNAGKPIAGKPIAGKPIAGKPNAGKPNAGRPNAGKPNAGKPNAAKPNTGNLAPSAGKKPNSGKPVGRPSREQAASALYSTAFLPGGVMASPGGPMSGPMASPGKPEVEPVPSPDLPAEEDPAKMAVVHLMEILSMNHPELEKALLQTSQSDAIAQLLSEAADRISLASEVAKAAINLKETTADAPGVQQTEETGSSTSVGSVENEEDEEEVDEENKDEVEDDEHDQGSVSDTQQLIKDKLYSVMESAKAEMPAIKETAGKFLNSILNIVMS
ncbi:Hypothetical protein NTJ_07639 [Nesidiocoris tenuis]|uniref:Uncharacterized protein n=1 Tax=Nesidiocoris tenuis TaxID=355587 RepID=A0ABN7AU02_9HEMI|nr:Hypothetical protein NTJ_07639 [Nesidiocoris tenuis]